MYIRLLYQKIKDEILYRRYIRKARKIIKECDSK